MQVLVHALPVRACQGIFRASPQWDKAYPIPLASSADLVFVLPNSLRRYIGRPGTQPTIAAGRRGRLDWFPRDRVVG